MLFFFNLMGWGGEGGVWKRCSSMGGGVGW